MGNEASKGHGGGAPPAQGIAPVAAGARPQLKAQNRDPLYYMKDVLRGSRGTGKTSLLRRLQGQPFAVDYVPTPEIQTSTFAWSYKSSDDKIEVEVWDVVDRVLADEQDRGVVDDDDAPAGA